MNSIYLFIIAYILIIGWICDLAIPITNMITVLFLVLTIEISARWDRIMLEKKYKNVEKSINLPDFIDK